MAVGPGWCRGQPKLITAVVAAPAFLTLDYEFGRTSRRVHRAEAQPRVPAGYRCHADKDAERQADHGSNDLRSRGVASANPPSGHHLERESEAREHVVVLED